MVLEGAVQRALSSRSAISRCSRAAVVRVVVEGGQAPLRGRRAGQRPLEHKHTSRNISHIIGLGTGPKARSLDLTRGDSMFPLMFLRRRRLGIEERLRRVENVILALAGKVKKMGDEQSFRTLQDSVTGAGGDLQRSFDAVIQAHDSGDDGKFEEAAQAHSDFINSFRSMGTSGNTATKAGQSPSGTAGASTGDLPQGRNQHDANRASGPSGPGATQGSPRREADAGRPPQGASSEGSEHDVVVKGRDMPG
jgi:hypothetical protein